MVGIVYSSYLTKKGLECLSGAEGYEANKPQTCDLNSDYLAWASFSDVLRVWIYISTPALKTS